MSTEVSSGGRRAHRVDGVTGRPRAARTLVALLAVGSLALTAAAAEPLAPQDRPERTSDVFALGAGGLGRIGSMALPPEEDEGGSREQGAVTTGGADGTGSRPVDASVVGVADAVEVPRSGEGVLASVIPAGLGAGGIPAPTLRAYRAAAEVLARESAGCAIDWALLAGIGRVESDHGRFGGATVTDLGVSFPAILGPRLDGSLDGTMVIRDSDGGALDRDDAYDRAVGPMQFLPGTWQRWGSDGDRDGASDPQDIDDAALAAARYLCDGRSGLEDPAEAAVAVRRYNNSGEYVRLVLATAEGYRSGEGLVPGGGYPTDPAGDPFDPFDDGWSPYTDVVPAPPGWQPPPAPTPTASPTATASPTVSPSPSVSPSPTTTPSVPTPSSSPTGTPAVTPSTPAASPTTPTPSPTGPSGEPSGSPTSTPTTPDPTPTDPVPPCDPTPTPTTTADPAPGDGTGGEPPAGPTGEPSATPTAPVTDPTTVLPPCPTPCGTPEPAPTPTPTCTPVEPSGTPTAP